MITIPLVEDNTSFDCCTRMYRRCILNVLHAIKPKYSLEIGSFLYQSSNVWSYWIENNMPDGKLITCDIAKWNNSPPPPHVEQVMVYPHIENSEDFHGGINIYYKDKPRHGSIEANVSAIENVMFGNRIEEFKLCFVDGDHNKKSFLADLEIAQRLTSKKYGWILIDDIADQGHKQYFVYQQLKKKNDFYEFEDWSDPKPGMALIQNKNLVLV